MGEPTTRIIIAMCRHEDEGYTGFYCKDYRYPIVLGLGGNLLINDFMEVEIAESFFDLDNKRYHYYGEWEEKIESVFQAQIDYLLQTGWEEVWLKHGPEKSSLVLRDKPE